MRSPYRCSGHGPAAKAIGKDETFVAGHSSDDVIVILRVPMTIKTVTAADAVRLTSDPRRPDPAFRSTRCHGAEPGLNANLSTQDAFFCLVDDQRVVRGIPMQYRPPNASRIRSAEV